MSPRHQILLAVLGKPLVLVFWVFVLWGSLMAPACLRALLTSGFDVRRLLPPAGAGGSVWAWLNLASAVLAACVWILAGFSLWQQRRPPG